MSKSPSRTFIILRWTARIWSLPAIIFMLGEVLFPHGSDTDVPFSDWLVISLRLASVFGLAIAWRWEFPGAVLALITSMAASLSFVYFRSEFFIEIELIFGAFVVLPALLFLFLWYQTRQAKPTSP